MLENIPQNPIDPIKQTNPVPAPEQKQTFSLPAKPDNMPDTPQKSAVSFLKNLMKREGTPSPSYGVQDPDKNAVQSQNGNGNAFTQMFGKSATTSTSSVKPVESAPTLPVLGPKTSLLRQKADELHEQKTASILKIVFVILAVLVAGGLSYLYIQLNPDFELFGKTIARDFIESTDKLKSIQTKKNEFNLRIAAMQLTRVNILGDSFLEDFVTANSATSGISEKLAASASLGVARESLKQSLKVIADALKEPLSVALPGVVVTDQTEYEKQFEEALTSSFVAQKDSAKGSSEARMFENLMSLVSDRALRGFLKNIKADSLDDTKLKEILGRIREDWTDDLSLIAQLKEKRIRWTEVFHQLDSVTREVDKLYGQNLFDQIGGIQYSNYEFNTDTKTISVSGLVKTEDTKTFTKMVDLVSALEKSPYFKNVEMRDFSKAKTSKEGGFSGSIRLTFNVQDVNETDPRDEEIPLNITP